jgi:hypothetical protein
MALVLMLSAAIPVAFTANSVDLRGHYPSSGVARNGCIWLAGGLQWWQIDN